MNLIRVITVQMRSWYDGGIFFLLMVLLILTGCQKTVTLPQSDSLSSEIEWHDEKLEAAVREVLEGHPETITVEDVRSIYILDISGCGITDITDLSLFTGLERLNVSNNYIRDLSPLFRLGLEDLDASYNDISSLKGIFRMKELHGLLLTGNSLTADSIQELECITELYDLRVSIPMDRSWTETSLAGCRNLYNLDVLDPTQDHSLNDGQTERGKLPGGLSGHARAEGYGVVKTEKMTWPYYLESSDRHSNYYQIEKEKNNDRKQHAFVNTFLASVPDSVKELIKGLFYIFVITSAAIMGQLRAAGITEWAKEDEVPPYIEGYPIREVQRCLKAESANKYLYRFVRLYHGKRVFNFAAAFLGPIWFAYQFMWKEALIVCGITAFGGFASGRFLADTGIVDEPFVQGGICVAVGLAAFMILGLTADGIYWSHIKRCLRRRKQKGKDAGGCPEKV